MSSPRRRGSSIMGMDSRLRGNDKMQWLLGDGINGIALRFLQGRGIIELWNH